MARAGPSGLARALRLRWLPRTPDILRIADRSVMRPAPLDPHRLRGRGALGTLARQPRATRASPQRISWTMRLTIYQHAARVLHSSRAVFRQQIATQGPRVLWVAPLSRVRRSLGSHQ